jgi:hypothetical protein
MANIEEVYKRDLAFVSDFVKTPTGDIDTVTGLRNYKDALFRRLITTPGSLAHRPLYGVGVKKYRNKLNTLANREKLARDIKQQFEQDPRTVEVVSVGFTSDDYKPETLRVHTTVESVGYGKLELQFSPFGGL